MIVITGGSGFVGSHLCSLLSEQGHSVRIIDLVPPQFGIKAEFVRASVLDLPRLQRLLVGAESVVHLAALIDVQASLSDPYSDFSVNVGGTINVLEAARKAGVSKVAFASSAAVYGNPTEIPVSESHSTIPLSPYGASKLASESYVLLYRSLYGMKNSALRLFNIYGKGQSAGSPYSGVITKFADAIAAGKQPLIYGDGEQTRDFVHVDDVAEAFSRALQVGGCDSPINIGSGKETSIMGLLSAMCDIAGKPPDPKFMDARAGEISRSVSDILLAKSKLGFTPKISLEEGLKELVQRDENISAL